MLLFKILGLAVIFGVSAAFGILKADGLKHRCDRLSGIIKSLNHLADLVRIGGYEIDELISICFESDILSFKKGNFLICEEYLLKEDISLLREFFLGFGVSDKEGEYERIRLFCALLEPRFAEAQKSYSEQGRLYRSVGLLGGLILCIFLM